MPLDSKTLADSYQIEMPTRDVVHMDVPYIDSVIQGQGPVFLHFRAIPCPVGLGDPYDIRKIHESHPGCSNGFIYEPAGEVVGIFSGNSKSLQLLDPGLVTGASAQVTLPRFYGDKPNEEVHVSPFDRLYLKEARALVVTFQRLEHNIGGYDRTSFPIVKVEHLIDADGISYYEGRDFQITSGQVQWIGRQPGMDPSTGKGRVIAIRYRYVPFWYVDRILHEIRVHPAVDPATGQTVIQRLPYAVLLQREYVFQNEQNDPRTDRARAATAPRDGSFGPR